MEALREKHPDSAAIVGELDAIMFITQAVVVDSFRSRMFAIRNAHQPGHSDVESNETVTRQQLFQPSSAFQGDCTASRIHDAFHESMARHAIPFASKQAFKELFEVGKGKGGKGRQTEADPKPGLDGSKGTDKRPVAGKK